MLCTCIFIHTCIFLKIVFLHPLHFSRTASPFTVNAAAGADNFKCINFLLMLRLWVFWKVTHF